MHFFLTATMSCWNILGVLIFHIYFVEFSHWLCPDFLVIFSTSHSSVELHSLIAWLWKKQAHLGLCLSFVSIFSSFIHFPIFFLIFYLKNDWSENSVNSIDIVCSACMFQGMAEPSLSVVQPWMSDTKSKSCWDSKMFASHLIPSSLGPPQALY